VRPAGGRSTGHARRQEGRSRGPQRREAVRGGRPAADYKQPVQPPGPGPRAPARRRSPCRPCVEARHRAQAACRALRCGGCTPAPSSACSTTHDLASFFSLQKQRWTFGILRIPALPSLPRRRRAVSGPSRAQARPSPRQCAGMPRRTQAPCANSAVFSPRAGSRATCPFWAPAMPRISAGPAVTSPCAVLRGGGSAPPLGAGRRWGGS